MKKRLLVMALVTVFVMGMASPAFAGTNLVVNGGFEDGNSGFSSQYDYVLAGTSAVPSAYDPGTYGVGDSANDFHSGWSTFAPHGGSMMMIVNGTAVDPNGHTNVPPDAAVWSETVALPAAQSAEHEYPLYAGQSWLVGTVYVSNTLNRVCLRLVLDPTLVSTQQLTMTEVHIAVASTVAGIPHNKSGNPVPGQFPINVTLNPGQTQYTTSLPWPAGANAMGPIVVAAHAVVNRPLITHKVTHTFEVYSGSGTALVSGGYATPASTVLPWDGAMQENLNAGPEDWIWDGEAMTSAVAQFGGMVDFCQAFDIVGTPKTATLKIAADNAFAFHLNAGGETSENLADGWRTQTALGNFAWPGVVVDPNRSGWSKVYGYDVVGDLHSGANTLYSTGVNALWNTDQWSVNPAAVIYQLTGTSEETIVDFPARTETAWGGTTDFPGANWAKYMSYARQTLPAYHFSMQAASSFDDPSPADLEVRINGVKVTGATLTSVAGTWMEIKGDWNQGSAASAKIEIRDLNSAYSGNDFCLDDISFSKN